jgi:leucyl-tRNA synthetase
VLANEQVDANGRSWRSGAKVEKRKLKQWFLRISEFREELLQGLDKLAEKDAWPERVLSMQKNWLGKSTGAQIKFPLMAFDHGVGTHIEVFTTRPETLFGVQYLALAATHPIVAKMAEKDPELQAFLDILPGLPPDSKVGYLLPHIRAINPLAYHAETPDEAKESIKVYVAPYVLGDYGEGAVMGVPGHDVRDHAFWKEHHYDEPIRVVLSASDDESTTAMLNEPFVDHGVMSARAGPYKGKSSTEAGQMLVGMLEEAGLAKSVEKWRLRDWLISRQRYWGTPIPIVHCGSCGPVPVPDDQLPVKLPEVDAHWAERKAGNPLETQDDWVNTSCPKCGGAAKRDTDTMDTFVDSSWYYMRFPDVHNKEAPFSAEKVRQFLPVDLYIGGIEHAILHLLYSRFIYKFLMKSPLVSNSAESDELLEPFKRLITQGMVQGKTYTDPANGRFLKPEEVDDSNPSKPVIIATGEQPSVSFEKMSKSKYNGVDPTDFIARYGADATRAHMIFQAAAGDTLNWDEDKVSGVTRWLHKLHSLVVEIEQLPSTQQSVKENLEMRIPQRDTLDKMDKTQLDADVAVWREVQKTIEATTAGYEKVYSLNTVVSNLMSLTNYIQNNKQKASGLVLKEALAALISMASPITPAFAEECWSILHPSARSIFLSSFPVPDGTAEELLQPRKQNCAVQVNGKLKGVVEIPVAPKELAGDELRDWVVAEVMKNEFAGNTADKIKDAKTVRVVGGGKLVNFVL